jgi:DNA repair ATPase RecN
MLNVKIKNFQSIGNISFDVEGFTVIVGKNNLGKSAIIRAIDAALTNRTGSEFVRWGKTKAEVSLKKDALDVSWAKGESATYKVNGQSFSKLNRAIPQPILDAGVKKIEIGDQKLNPLVAHQFEELFLLDKPGSVITDVLSVIYNLHILNDANDLCLKELKSKKSLLKIRESDRSSLQEQLDKYKDLELIKGEMKAIQELDRRSKELSSEINLLGRCVDEINRLGSEIKRLQKITQVMVPSPDPVEKELTEYTWFSQTIDILRGTLGLVRKLETASKVIVPEYAGMQELMEQLSDVIKCKDLLDTTESTFEALCGIANSLKPIDLLLSTLPAVEEKIKDTAEFSALAEGFLSSAKYAKALHVDIEKGSVELNKFQEEYSQYKTCPLCQKPLVK